MVRRRFLGGALVLVCSVPTFGAGCAEEEAASEPAPEDLGPWDVPAGAVLSPRRHALLAALMDALVPGSPEEPGATEARAAYYVDQLFGAFRTDPPRIFAGGPYSGRHGGLDGFSLFQPLTRVEQLRWRTYIEGSRGMPEREWNGPVKGIVERYEEGLDELDRIAQADHGAGFALLDREARLAVIAAADAEFIDTAYAHAVEGTYGDPVYGGNFEQKGWKVIDYEGDRQPVGFSAAEMAHPEQG